MTAIRYKHVDRQVLSHPIERRGFVSVPLDPAAPDAGTIDVFYRLIPAYGGTPDDASKPIIVVINGGPGIPSSFYRPLDFDYGAAESATFDRFKYLLRTHRVLIADQRGTDGCSAPLDMDDPGLDAGLVARHFSSDSHARDTAAIIDAVIPAGEPFYIIAQSYGGMPGMQYLGLPDVRMPAGIIFSSSALPYEDPLESQLARRREQLRLNLHLQSVVPDIAARLAAVRAHLSALGIDPGRLHGLYAALGKDVTGVWEPAFVARLDRMLTQTRDEILKDMVAAGEDVNLLNYILSSVNYTAGYTDRTLAAYTTERVPLEPWMIDENWLLSQTGQDGTWREAFVAALDQAPPPATPFPSVDALRQALGRTQALFTAAENDAFVPHGAFVASVAKFEVPGHTEVRTLPGGHHAIFLEKGHEAIVDWSAS